MKKFTLPFKSVREANDLRKKLISDIKNVAPVKVQVLKNDTPLLNEVLEHRIELIPFRLTDRSRIDEEFTFSLDIENDGTDNVEVTCLDIIPIDPKGQKVCLPVSQFKGTEVKKNGGILLCYLYPNRSLKIEFTVSSGTSEEHAKFNPLIYCSYASSEKDKYDFFLESNESMSPEDCLAEGLKLL